MDDPLKIYTKNYLPAIRLSTANVEGRGAVMVEVPDLTNTSRAVSGFALSQLDGMAEPDLFQFFYVPFNLSHSVQVGETLAVEMVVFNYPGKEITAEVTWNPEWFRIYFRVAQSE